MKTKKVFEQELEDSFNAIDENQIIQGHILKFIHKSRHHIDKGIVCHPQQTYGNAEQAPDNFKNKHSFVPKNGYFYRHQIKPQFKYYSQKKYYSIDGSTNGQKSKQIHYEDTQNPLKFHKKKGRLSEFMDKNGWMNKTTKLMGFQRDDQGRQFSNKDKNKRILQLKPKIDFKSQYLIKPQAAKQYVRTLGTFTSQKMRIRASRNSEAERFSEPIKPREIHSSHRLNAVQFQAVNREMLQKVKDWSPSKLSRSKYEQFSKTFHSKRLSKQQNEMQDRKNSTQFSWRQHRNNEHQQNLQDWYKTTCNSKWIYQKDQGNSSNQQDL